jgi:uncharacterized membrane protein
MKFTVAYVTGLLAFVLIDLAWINLVVLDAYQQSVGHLIIDQPRLFAVVAFYLVYTAGLILLAVRPALRVSSAGVAGQNGAILGGFAYGTYAFTNYAMFGDWTWHLVWTDILWGIVLSSLVSWIAYRAASPLAEPGSRAEVA